MKKKYSERQLASLIKEIIQSKYSDPEYFYAQFKYNIDRKTKSLIQKDLIDSELNEYGVKLSKIIIKNFPKIKIELIQNKISPEIIREFEVEGGDLNEKRKYFESSAKERVRELLNFEYKMIKTNKRKKR